MSSKKAGARRRVFTLSSAILIAVALAAFSTGAGATSKCEDVLGTSTFTDTIGDGSGANAPDISDITVTTYDRGLTEFQVSLPEVDAFSADMLVRTYIDSDKNAETGDENGYEYMIQTTPGSGAAAAKGLLKAKCEEQPLSKLFAWDGSAWVEQESERLSSWYGENSLTLKLNASEVGKALTFDFAVYAASHVTYDESGLPDSSTAAFDRAPDEGSYTYKPFEWSEYSDTANDGSAEGAPDLTTVAVTKWKGDLLKFDIPIPGVEEFGEDMLIRIPIDSDSDPTTGDANGYDYMVQAQRVSFEEKSLPMATRGALRSLCYQPQVVLLKWDGSNWVAVDDASLEWWYSKGLKLSLDSSALGSPASFNFAVYAATNVSFDESGWPDLTKDPAFDRAPDTGSYAFPLTVASGELEGVYIVTSRVIKSTGHLQAKKRISKSWTFHKRCAKKKCSTKASVRGHGNYKLSRAGRAVLQGSRRNQGGLQQRGRHGHDRGVQHERQEERLGQGEVACDQVGGNPSGQRREEGLWFLHGRSDRNAQEVSKRKSS